MTARYLRDGPVQRFNDVVWTTLEERLAALVVPFGQGARPLIPQPQQPAQRGVRARFEMQPTEHFRW
jgi:hypothetical protein